jgi:hypothetical protein
MHRIRKRLPTFWRTQTSPSTGFPCKEKHLGPSVVDAQNKQCPDAVLLDVFSRHKRQTALGVRDDDGSGPEEPSLTPVVEPRSVTLP